MYHATGRIALQALRAALLSCALLAITRDAAADRQMPADLARKLKSHPTGRALSERFYRTPTSAGPKDFQRNATDIQLMLGKVFDGTHSPRVVRLHAKSRAAFNTPAHMGSMYSLRFEKVSCFSDAASQTINEEAGAAVRAARANAGKLGSPYIMLSDDQNKLDIWSAFVHEASHLRFGQALEKHIDRLAMRFPTYVKKTPAGYSMKNTLYHLLSEWYAFEMGYRAFETQFGAGVSREVGAAAPTPFGSALPEPRARQQAITDFIFKVYRINDATLQEAARGKSLSEFMKYGERGSREALQRKRARARH